MMSSTKKGQINTSCPTSKMSITFVLAISFEYGQSDKFKLLNQNNPIFVTITTIFKLPCIFRYMELKFSLKIFVEEFPIYYIDTQENITSISQHYILFKIKFLDRYFLKTSQKLQKKTFFQNKNNFGLF